MTASSTDDDEPRHSAGCSPLSRRRRRHSHASSTGVTTSTADGQHQGRPPTSSTSSTRFRKVIDAVFFSRRLKKAKAAVNDDEEPDEGPEEVVSLMLQVRLHSGRNLPVKDASGSSDPYVRLKYKTELVYKSSTVYKSLNPVWDEEFQLIVDDVNEPLNIEVFDFDRFCSDDYMGGADVDLSQIKWFTPTEVNVDLKNEYLASAGSLSLSLTLSPLTNHQLQSFMQKANKGVLTTTKRKEKIMQTWTKVVNVVVVEGKNIRVGFSTGEPPDSFCKFKLGIEKYKTKVFAKSFEPKWIEQFDLHVYENGDENLQMVCVDKTTNDVIGRVTIDVDELGQDETLQRWFDLDSGNNAKVLLLITVSGAQSSDAVVDFVDFNFNDVRNSLLKRYDVMQTFVNAGDIGTLTVKVYGAEDVAAKDIGGKSDPFVVAELVNTRLQTHTEYKTLNPQWNKLFTFKVKDIHTCLEVTVYDEDPNNKFDFLGKVAIPLLTIQNCEKRWFALKDRKLKNRVKGEILLEMDIIWNPVRAAFRTFKPRERKFVEPEKKFKASVFRATVSELKDLGRNAVELMSWLQSVFAWESTTRTTIAFIVFLLGVYNIQLYHLPLLLACVFAKNFVLRKVSDGANADAPTSSRISEDEGSNSLRDTIFSVQDTLVVVQNSLVLVVQMVQRVQHTLNFTNPWLSTLAMIVLLLACLLLYLVPLRWIVLIWGVNKFTKKLRNPNFVDNNELIDFLSRVPSDAEMVEWNNKRLAKAVPSP